MALLIEYNGTYTRLGCLPSTTWMMENEREPRDNHVEGPSEVDNKTNTIYYQ